MARTGHAAAERQELADALAAADPAAPTLCEGWTVLDLAAHLVVRDRRPDTLPGLVLPVLSGWTDRVRRQATRRGLPALVRRFRRGPGRLTPFALPGAEESANLLEFFVHGEDVRRAGDGWRPRDLPPERAEALWHLLGSRGRLLFRRAGTGVVLEHPDGRHHRARPGSPQVVLRGAPGELLLFATGRRDHALVRVDGPDDAVRRLLGTPAGL